MRLKTPKEGKEKGGRTSQQEVKKKGQGIQCYKYQGFGRVAAECPSAKKKDMSKDK